MHKGWWYKNTFGKSAPWRCAGKIPSGEYVLVRYCPSSKHMIGVVVMNPPSANWRLDQSGPVDEYEGLDS